MKGPDRRCSPAGRPLVRAKPSILRQWDPLPAVGAMEEAVLDDGLPRPGEEVGHHDDASINWARAGEPRVYPPRRRLGGRV